MYIFGDTIDGSRPHLPPSHAFAQPHVPLSLTVLCSLTAVPSCDPSGGVPGPSDCLR